MPYYKLKSVNEPKFTDQNLDSFNKIYDDRDTALRVLDKLSKLEKECTIHDYMNPPKREDLEPWKREFIEAMEKVGRERFGADFDKPSTTRPEDFKRLRITEGLHIGYIIRHDFKGDENRESFAFLQYMYILETDKDGKPTDKKDNGKEIYEKLQAAAMA